MAKKKESASRHGFLEILNGFDFVQIIALVFLIAMGLIFIHSTGVQIGSPSALEAFNKQLMWVTGGVVLWIAGSCIYPNRMPYKVFSVLFYVVTLLLLLLLIPFGITVNGARSWLDIPGTGFRLQPSEFTKLSVIMLLSVMFPTTVFSPNKLLCVLLSLVTVLIPFSLVFLEPDFGSALILIPIYLGILFCSGFKWRYIIILGTFVLIVGGLVAANEYYQVKPVLKKYQRDRIDAFFHPEKYLRSTGYQPYQAKLAVASGGLFGKGIGQGMNSLGFLPQMAANNDFIFAIIAEEIGFFGCALILVAFLMLLYSILRTAFVTNDPCGRYLCVGTGAIILTHCLINIGMSLGLMPVTGVSLPFISYGGSFFLMLMAACGLMQAAYRNR